MEDVIIGLLFVYFFVIRPILKQARKGDAKKQSTGQRSPLGTLMEKLREKMQEIAEEAAAVRREKAQRSPGNTWKELFTESAQGSPERQSWETAPDSQEVAWPLEEPWTTVEPEPAARGWAVADATEPEPAHPRAPAAVVQPAPARRPARYGVNLRQAVVWSEILGPPVSLRDGG